MQKLRLGVREWIKTKSNHEYIFFLKAGNGKDLSVTQKFLCDIAFVTFQI